MGRMGCVGFGFGFEDGGEQVDEGRRGSGEDRLSVHGRHQHAKPTLRNAVNNLSEPVMWSAVSSGEELPWRWGGEGGGEGESGDERQ